MAKFRGNHEQASAGTGMVSKVGIFGALLAGIYFLFNFFSAGDPSTTVERNYESPAQTQTEEEALILPTSTTGQVIRHKYYALSYNEKYEVAEWVSYELFRDNLTRKWVDRTDDFREDRQVKTGSAAIMDYRRSGYDRGHLAPAGDMAFNREAMSESFYLSNIAPQVHNFNTGIWRELEENTRDWAKKFRHLYISTGPILTEEPIDYIGENQVAVPSAFYKVILDLSEPEYKGIGFIIPNKVSFKPLTSYAVSIDEVEAATGIDFFSKLMERSLEKSIESRYSMNAWNVSDRRYELRKKKWNKN